MYVAEGAYGCVFNPAVKQCSKRNSTPTVTKVFKYKWAAHEEYNATELVKQLDPNGIFTIRAFGSCPVSRDKFAEAEMIKCSILENVTANRLHQIVYEYGGVTLDRVSWDDIWDKFGALFYGIEALQNAGMAHMDIKEANTVYDAKTGKLALIDFGLCRPLKHVFTKNTVFLAFGIYTPPEIADHALKTLNRDEINELMSRPNSSSIKKKCSETKANKEITRKPIDNLINLLSYSKRSKLKKQMLALEYHNRGQVYNPYLVDSYMLGATLFETCHNKIDTRTRKGRAIADLVMGLMHPDPCERWPINKGKLAYNEILKM
jgi:serine/threonine protein kinase